MALGSTDNELIAKIKDNISKVIIGKNESINLLVASMICGGHVLIQDVPGVGKTKLAKAFAQSVGLTFKRIQFTPDMLPSDITGVNIFDLGSNEFHFRSGPISAQLVLADEINRATPKTQAALLEAMEEHQVTVDGLSHSLPDPFLVIATLNPVEYEGTFPLPEAELDRFFMCISLGYPSFDDEVQIIEEQRVDDPLMEINSVINIQEFLRLQKRIRNIFVDKLVTQYIVSIVGATRQNENVVLGASPRASLSLSLASQAWALMDGREYVLPDDVKDTAVSVLAHRIIVSSSAKMSGLDSENIVNSIIGNVPIPGIR
ncbi:MAG: AAA family ATPase [Chloroflexi bacterium]|nr:AAA family ATPase [Chloroflexota bacterium]|tara:strand:+ start:412 stop:1362 length:951 start_codon:yes stop_codon:yes gene_type:complete